jgi:hypothetical protein
MSPLTADDRSKLGRILASFRQHETKACRECGATFTGLVEQYYCTVRCKNRDHSRRWRARRRGQPPSDA